MPPVCLGAGRHRRTTCSAEIRKPVNQHSCGCGLDKSGGVLLGQLDGIGLAKVNSTIGERGFFQLRMEFGRDSSME